MSESTSEQTVDVDEDDDAVDPTDAPDLTGSALTRMSRFGLLGSLAEISGAVLVLVLSVVSPDRISLPVARAVGVVVAVLAVVVAVEHIRPAGRGRSASLAVAAVAAVAGVLLVVDPSRWLTPIGWVVGGMAVLAGVSTVGPWRSTAPEEPAAGLGLGLIAVGAVVFFFAEPLFELAAVACALLLVASGLIGLGLRSGLVTVAPATANRRPMLVRWIDAKVAATSNRQDLYDAVFFEGESAPSRIGRFLLMMLLASVISAAGVVSDSTAVVIGAMLVAPLINPMMGMGLALVTGWPNRLGRSTLVVLGGSLVAVGTGWILPVATDIAVDVGVNAQIVSRSSPTMVDLAIALAAGAAGAYALSRRDASSSLPGVAVAIALVPPLSVVGITAQAGDWAQAAGTLLLFLTNLVAIIVAGGVVFVLTGVVPIRRFAENQHRVRTAIGAVGALAVIVVGGLVINGRQITADALDQEEARAVTAEWLGEASNFDVVSVTVDDGNVGVVLTGPGTPPPAERLAVDLERSLGGHVRLDLQWIPRERVIIESG